MNKKPTDPTELLEAEFLSDFQKAVTDTFDVMTPKRMKAASIKALLARKSDADREKILKGVPEVKKRDEVIEAQEAQILGLQQSVIEREAAFAFVLEKILKGKFSPTLLRDYQRKAQASAQVDVTESEAKLHKAKKLRIGANALAQLLASDPDAVLEQLLAEEEAAAAKKKNKK